jgi:hypothetical protein
MVPLFYGHLMLLNGLNEFWCCGGTILDSLTVLSLAGNVIQFIDFASKLFIKGREIYNSAESLLVYDQELEMITKDL